jgi:UDPglucose 6-dehydrogenase
MRIVERLKGRIGRDITVAVLGLAYKPFSHVTEHSQALMLVRAFLEQGARVVAYDPLAGSTANVELGGRALILDSACACLRDADVVLVATPDPEFGALGPDDFRRLGRTVTVVDFWRILAGKLSGVDGIEYVAYGRGSTDASHDGTLKQLWSETAAHYGC